METLVWIFMFMLTSLLYKWILSWGGAQWLKRYSSFFILGWFTEQLSTEQIWLYALVCWVISTIWFIIGVFHPTLRLVDW